MTDFQKIRTSFAAFASNYLSYDPVRENVKAYPLPENDEEKRKIDPDNTGEIRISAIGPFYCVPQADGPYVL